MPRLALIALALSLTGGPVLHAQDVPPPIIDMHIHALGARQSATGWCLPMDPFPVWDPEEPYSAVLMRYATDPPCDDPVWAPDSDDAMIEAMSAIIERRNIYGVLTGSQERIDSWMSAMPGRFMPGHLLFVGREGVASADSLRGLHESGRLEVLAEVANQYSGLPPDDPDMDPYWELAEELDIPVGIHIGTGPPGVRYLASPAYRGALHDPLTLEPVLMERPGLRVYVMHAGYPMLEEMLTLLYNHPQVHVDIAAIIVFHPRAAVDRYLQRLVEAGFSNRILFGSDSQFWPQGIERALMIIEEAPYLTDEQKRDILYNNAARFLRLDEETIQRHHAGG